MQKLKRLVFWGVVTFLTSCSLSTTKIDQPPVYTSNIVLPEQWNITGKIAIQSLQQGWQANFTWNKDKNSQWLRFSGPIGQEYFQLKQYYKEQQLINELWKSGSVYQASSMESLLEQQTGMKLPVKSLSYWIFGRYNPNLPVTLFAQDKTKLLSHFEQQDWQIQFSYQKKLLPYPRKLIAQQNWIKLKVVITDFDSALKNHE